MIYNIYHSNSQYNIIYIYNYRISIGSYLTNNLQIAKLRGAELQHCFRNSSSKLSPSSWHWGSMMMHALENGRGSWGHGCHANGPWTSNPLPESWRILGRGRTLIMHFPKLKGCWRSNVTMVRFKCVRFQCFRMWSWEPASLVIHDA